MTEILSIVFNFILASGLIGTFIFYRSKKRQADAEADESEANVESKSIQNAQQSAVEWKEIALDYKSDNKTQSELIDRLYAEKGEDRKVIHTLTEEGHKKELLIMELTYKSCNKRACEGREPQTGY